ncbi:MAG: hypothetical protein HY515_03235 [Candidatus Aenigmarchaeota archaeon]|nr:hypothetical protein [Candidatus Aenigmarchaeota archaeon]
MSISGTVQKDNYSVAGRIYSSRLFHCFGNPDIKLTVSTVKSLLENSCTQFLTLNTHNISTNNGMDSAVIGYTNINLHDISKVVDISKYTILVNINLAKTSKEAVERSVVSSELIGSKIIKLEVLNKEHTIPLNEEVKEAAKSLLKRGYEIMPLINPDLNDALKLQNMGCSLIRILGSPIGSMKGIENEKSLEEIFQQLKIPVILDGGVGCPQDAYNAMKLGATGVLVNKALFASSDPVQMIIKMKKAIIEGRLDYIHGGRHV